MKIKLISHLYNTYNASLFDGKLPNDVKFAVTAARSYFGCAICLYDPENLAKGREYKIHIAKEVERTSRRLVTLDTILIHEMIHIYQYVTYPQKWVLQNKAAGHDRVFMNYLDIIEYQHRIPMFRDFEY